jgi:hypothetical protein
VTAKIDLVRFQEIKCRDIFVGEPADHFAVIVSAVDGIVPTLEHLVGAVFNPCFFLQAISAADTNIAAAHYGDAADVKMVFNQHDFDAFVPCCVGSAQARCPGANNNDVHFTVPSRAMVGVASLGGSSARSGQSGCATDAGYCALCQEIPTAAA